jgi:hypothetical protein
MRVLARGHALAIVGLAGCAPSEPARAPAVAPVAQSYVPPAPPQASDDAGTALVETEPETKGSPPADTPEERLARYRALWKSPRHRPDALDRPPSPVRLLPGAYSCRVSREYKLRECTVERDADGRTFLEFAAGNLLGMRGVVTESGGALEFEGYLTEEQPFGCSSCQERCIVDPSSCGCDPLPAEAVVECLAQPLRFSLRASPKGGSFHGVLPYRVYYNDYVGEGAARRAEGFTFRQESFAIDLIPGPPNARR